MAQSRLCLPGSPGTRHLKAAVSMSRVAQWPSHRVPSVGTQLFMCVLMLQNSHRPNGKIAYLLASILACTFAADPPVNYRGYVLQRPETAPSPQSSQRPDGIFHISCACACRAAVFASTVARWPSHHAPSPATQLLLCVLTLKISHRPDGKMPCPNGIFTCFALVLAGRRCLCREWHGKLRVVHHHWQLSYLCACSAQNFPSPRWGENR